MAHDLLDSHDGGHCKLQRIRFRLRLEQSRSRDTRNEYGPFERRVGRG